MPKVNPWPLHATYTGQEGGQVTAVHYVFVMCQVLERACYMATSNFLLVCPPGLLI